jgi:hypothetical protein
MADTVTTPDFTGVVDQTVFLRPLGGPSSPLNYLDRFPEEIYNKSIDSHLVRFLYALLGPAGVGWLRTNYLQARLKLEDFGLETFDLDRFYGDPLKFGRILDEIYDIDPNGLIPRDRWEEIRAKDAKYRNRAIDFVNGARAGNTPLGMRLVARSGLGHEVEIIENYKWLYDQLSDDPIEIDKFGYTDSTGEFTIIPRRELPQSEVQTIRTIGTPTGGTFKLFFPIGNEDINSTADIAFDTNRSTAQAFLESIPSIGAGNVAVTGGPLPAIPLEVHFTRELGYRDVPQLQVIPALTGDPSAVMLVETAQSGVEQADETVSMSPRDKRYLREAVERIKPVASLATFAMGKGTTSRQIWASVEGTSTYNEIVRYVTGQNGITWPDLDNINWIEKSVEHQAPRAYGDLQHHYAGFHNITSVTTYGEDALTDVNYLTDNWPANAIRYPNNHVGRFSAYQRALFPFLDTPYVGEYTADRSLADYAEPIAVAASTQGDTPVQLVNGIYPVNYQSLAGVPEIKYKNEQFWASVERTEGDDYLEIDLGSVQAVNYMYFEVSRKPYNISLDYDLLDQAPSRAWQTVVLNPSLPSITNIGYEAGSPNPWQIAEIWFQGPHETLYTRFLRLKFARRLDASSPFLANDGTKLPYSVEVRNLRVARNVS